MFRKDSPFSMGGAADSYYEYLLKQWIQTGKTTDWSVNKSSIFAVTKRVTFKNYLQRFTYKREFSNSCYYFNAYHSMCVLSHV